MELSRILMGLLFVTACAASGNEAKRPWTIEVATSGGFSGRGIGTFAIDSEGRVSVRKMNDEACSWQATDDELAAIEKLLAATDRRKWHDSYVGENTCCDRLLYALTVDEAGRITGTRWIDAPPPMPADLAALGEAIVGAGKSLRAESAERCK